MKKRKIRITFFYYTLSSFVKKDLEILQNHYNVDIVKWHGKRDLIKILIKVIKSDLTYSWFAGDNAFVAVFFSKIFKKKSIIIVGGGDVAKIPEINYGRFTCGWKQKAITKYALKKADILLPVSNHTKNELFKRVKPKRVEIIYNGVDNEEFCPKVEKEKIIVTIGNITQKIIKLKGLETYAMASCHYPDYKFVIIGKIEEKSKKEMEKINPNLIFTGKISHNEVLYWLQRAKIYCQLSYVESFGMSVAEAMSCECIPIVTNRGALPELVGDAGFYVKYGNVEETINAIKKAIDSKENISKKSRERIEKMFSLKKRESKIIKIINEELKG